MVNKTPEITQTAASIAAPPVRRKRHAAGPSSMHSLKKQTARTGYLFIALPLLSLMAFMYFPIIESGYLSLCNWSLLGTPSFTGMDNFRTLLHDEVFLISLTNTFKWVLIYVPLSVVTSFGLALLLDMPLRHTRIYRTVFYIPVVAPILVVALLFMWVYNKQYGILNYLLYALFKIDAIGWLADPKLSLFSIAVMSVWKWAGYNMLIFLAALQGIDNSLYEAAALDGVTPWRKLINIKIPLVMPSIYFVMLTCVIDAFQIFTEVYTMTEGGPGYSTYTVAYYLYKSAFEYSKMGYACAMAVVMFVIIMAVTLIQNKLMDKRVQYDA